MTNEEKDKVRSEFYGSIDKSENDLEQKITYISAGALGLSLTFLENIIDLKNAEYFIILQIGWILLVITLSVNLISTLISRKMTMKTLKEFDDEIAEIALRNNIEKRNKQISNLDFSSLITLLAGILLIVIFCSVNLQNRKNNKDMPEKDLLEKGRIISTPRPTTESGNSGNSSQESSSSNSDSSSSDKK